MPQPTREDRFSFGLWTVGWPARDPFGDATRPALDPVESVHRLAELGAYGVTFHDDDLIPFGTDAAERDRLIARFRAALDETGMVVPMMTTNLFTHPVFKDGAFTSNDRGVRRFALRKVLRNLDLAAELGAQTYVFWGGREGAEVDAGKDIARRAGPLPRGHRPARRLRQGAAATASGSPSSPSPTSRAATSCCPPSATRWRSSPSSSTATSSGINPEVGHEQMAGLNYTAGIAQALWAGKLFHLDLNGQRGIKYDQDLVFGHGDLINAFSTGRPAGARRARRRPALRRPAALRLQAAAHRGRRRACGRRRPRTCAPTCCCKERAAAFRADPEVVEALAVSGVAELAKPTLEPRRGRGRPAGRPLGVRGLRRRTRRASAATATSGSTSWPSST